MVYVDPSNPFLRDYFPKWLRNHEAALNFIRSQLPSWAEATRQSEAEAARLEGRKARPLAVVFDIDEVLLCNIHLNGFQAPAGVQGPDPIDFHIADFFVDRATGKTWVRDDPGDPPLPGANALLAETVVLGLRPFFVTGRLESIRDITVEDFRRAGFTRSDLTPDAPLAANDLRDTLVMCPDGEHPPPTESIRPWKEGRRAVIEKDYRIALNVGDQVSDLGLHGDRQFYLPHPFYTTL